MEGAKIIQLNSILFYSRNKLYIMIFKNIFQYM